MNTVNIEQSQPIVGRDVVYRVSSRFRYPNQVDVGILSDHIKR